MLTSPPCVCSQSTSAGSSRAGRRACSHSSSSAFLLKQFQSWTVSVLDSFSLGQFAHAVAHSVSIQECQECQECGGAILPLATKWCPGQCSQKVFTRLISAQCFQTWECWFTPSQTGLAVGFSPCRQAVPSRTCSCPVAAGCAGVQVWNAPHTDAYRRSVRFALNPCRLSALHRP